MSKLPPSWEVFNADQFSTAALRNPGELGMELLAQVHPNSRILDRYRISLGKSKIVDVSGPMAAIFPGVPATWRLRYQIWPRDIEIRRNMATSSWININSLLTAKEAWTEEEGGAVIQPDTVLKQLEGKKAALRFAITIRDNQAMQLVVQSLPTSAETLMGKPAFRG
jgi:hypothetical protein